MIDFDLLKKEIGKHNLQYWDCRCVESKDANLFLWNKELKTIGERESFGVGLRVLSNGSWGFAGTNKLDKVGLKNMVKNAIRCSKLVNQKDKFNLDLDSLKSVKDKKKILGKQKVNSLDIEEKKKLVLEPNYEIKDEIKSVYLRYRDFQEKKVFLNPFSEIEQESEGIFLFMGVSASSSGKSEEKISRIANLGGFEKLKNVQERLNETISRSKKFLHAKSFNPGEKDVILSGELTGLFVHEALGHAAEADFVFSDATCLKNLIGKKISNDNVSVLDDPTQDNYSGWGSYYYDDEGIKSKKNYILKKGVFNSFLHNFETATKMNVPFTGNARAEGALSKPIIRMSNTYLEKGKSSFDELISEMKNGYFLKGFQGGETDPSTGGFQFGLSDVYLVENGEIKEPLRGGAIAGNTLTFLKKIKLVEDKYSEDSPGVCGKKGQHVLAGGRNPAVFVKGAVLI